MSLFRANFTFSQSRVLKRMKPTWRVKRALAPSSVTQQCSARMQMPYNSWDSEEVDALPHQRPLCHSNSRLENRLSGFESEFCSETCKIFNGVLKFWSLFTKKLQCCLQFVSIDISPFLQVVQRVVSFVKTPGNIFFDAFKLLIEWTVFWRWQILRASVYQFLGRYWVNHLKAFILKPGHKLGKICGFCNLSMEESIHKILVLLESQTCRFRRQKTQP